MPVILKPDGFNKWLDGETSVEDALDILQENRGEDLVAYRVGTAVNNNSNRGPELIEPIVA